MRIQVNYGEFGGGGGALGPKSGRGLGTAIMDPSACRVGNVFIGAMKDFAAMQMNFVTSSPNPP